MIIWPFKIIIGPFKATIKGGLVINGYRSEQGIAFTFGSGDDKSTFDSSLKWTNDNLKRPDDHLFSWLYGKKSGTEYGILTDRGGNNTATDGDTDIALSLVFASVRWADPAYLPQAKAIISDIWDHEVVMINGKPYIAANNLEKASHLPMVANPSYLSPYAYRVSRK